MPFFLYTVIPGSCKALKNDRILFLNVFEDAKEHPSPAGFFFFFLGKATIKCPGHSISDTRYNFTSNHITDLKQ